MKRIALSRHSSRRSGERCGDGPVAITMGYRISKPMTPGLAVGVVLASASGYSVGALGVAAASPFLLTAVRLALAATVLSVFALATGARWPRGHQLAHSAVVGLLGHGVHFAGLYAGLAAGVPAALSALVFGLNPVLTAALVGGMLRERFNLARLVGLVLGVAAVVCALGNRVVAAGGLDAGSVLSLIGLAGLATSTVWQQRFCAGIDLRSGGAVQLTAAVPVLIALAAVEQGTVRDPATAAWVVLWLVVINSILGTLLLLSAIRRAGAARATTVFCLVPSVAAVMAWPMVGQVPSTGTLGGLMLGAAAVVLSGLPRGLPSAGP
jgi:drug/metabolite transporter (DMT)-like permease